ncbi:hypothetical protein D3C77_689790 [compost metagenome]
MLNFREVKLPPIFSVLLQLAHREQIQLRRIVQQMLIGLQRFLAHLELESFDSLRIGDHQLSKQHDKFLIDPVLHLRLIRFIIA